VTVDGSVVEVQGMRVDPSRARIEVDGARISIDPRHRYILLNKPPGVVTTARDPEGRRTVLDLVHVRGRVYPVGRLDAETSGLLLLTDHGDLAHRLTHPRYEVRRTYVAEVLGVPPPAAIARLKDGVRLDDGVARAVAARIRGKTSRRAQVEMTLTEGRKHEVRRMLEGIGFPVERLVRISYGPLRLGDLPAGKIRHLTPKEAGALLASVGL
jgi:pseudouridine synthase